MELCLRHGQLWRPTSSPSPSLHKPDVQKLRGDTLEAESLRQRWQTRVEEQLQRYRDAHAHTTPHETWEQICLICRNTAAQVCGIVSQSYDKPWLKGREGNIQLLDQIIAQARRADHQARLNLDGLPPDQHAQLCRRNRLILRQARKNKHAVIATWEEEWMNMKASLADQAAAQGRMGTVFHIIRELSNAKDHHRKFGLRRSEDPNTEAEAWKEHFKEIQAGVGDIPEHVWQDVAPCPELADWLSAPPTWEEFRKSINDMASGKAPGSDLFMTEYLKFAGDVLLKEVFSVVTSVWQQACSADSPNEAMTWPQGWQQGIIFPLWKRKGDRHNKNTWRGITLLSVGSKLVARICAAHLQRWVQPWLNPFQFGFRKGSGVDDVQQVTRNILEEAAGSVHDKVLWLRFYDMEKAYPKVSRPGHWRLLQIKGCPPSFLKVLKAIHDHTSSYVRFEGAQSQSFVPDRGLREGCPSSPVLFNIYHSGIMEVFRARRSRLAQTHAWTPGILWSYKVDGKLGKRRLDRLEEGRNVKTKVL